MNDNYFTQIEVCPHCMNENEYPMWDTETSGFITTCKHCGKEIFLCDACRHTEDNPFRHCDWHETECGGKCFRGFANS